MTKSSSLVEMKRALSLKLGFCPFHKVYPSFWHSSISYLVVSGSGVTLWTLSALVSLTASVDCPLVIGRTVALIDDVDTTVAWPRGGTTAVKVVAVSWALDVTVGKTVAVGVACVIGRILAVLVAAGLTALVDVGLIVAVGGMTGTIGGVLDVGSDKQQHKFESVGMDLGVVTGVTSHLSFWWVKSTF